VKVAQAHRLIGERIRSLRLETLVDGKPMSQRELAERVQKRGWHDATEQRIGEIERNERRLRIEEALAIAEALGTNGAWLIDGVGIAGRPVAIEGVTAQAAAKANAGTLKIDA